ncbi:MAG: hypothetical protein M3494_13155 [Actinomycetota bacterium]|jgi:hypothetical protein|nr:hypothetical protein [Rubrobacter sp.]MDQ3508941.1 hypothetical protein [Actinomycetota bacterium]
MDERRWYEAEALMADLTSHRHAIPGASEEEIEQRMRSHYPDAVAILAREETRTEARRDLHRKQDTRGGF